MFTPQPIKIERPTPTQAMKDLAVTKAVRKKFGVTFHKKMDLKTIAKQWAKAQSKNPLLLVQNPGIGTVMTLAAIAINSQDVANQATVIYTKAIEVEKEITKAVSSAMPTVASVPPAPNPVYDPAYVANKATQVGKDLATKIQTEATILLTNQAINLLTTIPVI